MVNPLAATAGQDVVLDQSHGCIHISPHDRDAMIRERYLAAGVELEVRGYDTVGPP
jgi:hypothetical protein